VSSIKLREGEQFDEIKRITGVLIVEALLEGTAPAAKEGGGGQEVEIREGGR
jgi:hypothetical protein